MSSPKYDERYGEFLRLLPLNKYNVTKSAREAGFAEHTARTQQKKLMQQALKYKLEQSGLFLKRGEAVGVAVTKKTMAELIGFSKQEVFDNLKFLGTQEKDLGVRLRVMTPVAKELGVNLEPEEKQSVIVPTLHITMEAPNEPEPMLESGLVEPH